VLLVFFSGGLRHDEAGGRPSVRQERTEAARRGRGRAARLLLGQRADHVRGARPVSAREGGRAHRQGRQHLRRQVRHQPQRRTHFQRTPTWCYRYEQKQLKISENNIFCTLPTKMSETQEVFLTKIF